MKKHLRSKYTRFYPICQPLIKTFLQVNINIFIRKANKVSYYKNKNKAKCLALITTFKCFVFKHLIIEKIKKWDIQSITNIEQCSCAWILTFSIKYTCYCTRVKTCNCSQLIWSNISILHNFNILFVIASVNNNISMYLWL